MWHSTCREEEKRVQNKQETRQRKNLGLYRGRGEGGCRQALDEVILEQREGLDRPEFSAARVDALAERWSRGNPRNNLV